MTTLNPADKAPVVTLSGGDLTAVCGSGFSPGIVRSTTNKVSGKYAFEVTLDVLSNTAQIGLCSSTYTLASYLGSAGSVAYAQNGTITNEGNAVSSSQATLTAGKKVLVCCDFTAGKVYFLVDGVAQAGGDPAAGTGGAALGASYYPAPAGDNGSQFTFNFGATAFTTTLPTGYSAWDAASGTAATGTSAGAGVASGVGGELSAATGTSAGAGATTGVGSALSRATGTSAGAGAVAGAGSAISQGTATSAGAGAASGVGSSVAAGTSVGQATGAGAAVGSGRSLALSAGVAGGTGAVAGVGAYAQAVAGSAAGTAAVAGVPLVLTNVSATGTASGAGAVSGVPIIPSTAVATGVAIGSANVTGKGYAAIPVGVWVKETYTATTWTPVGHGPDAWTQIYP